MKPCPECGGALTVERVLWHDDTRVSRLYCQACHYLAHEHPGREAREEPRERAGRALQLTRASTVKAEPVRWLWPGYVPQGKVTVLAGAPGLGKSLLTVMLAAEVSKGADVLIASAEDDPGDTIKPRLLAAGADCDRVHLLDVREVTPEGVAVPGIVQLPGDAHELHCAVAENGARLVILDPVAAFLDGEHSAYREQEVRAALAPLKLMAEDTGAAVMLVMHLNKADGADPLRRIGNSGAFTALARSVLLFGPDPEDEEGDRGARRVLTVAKGNVRAAGRGSLLARIVERRVEAPGGEITSAALEIVSSSSVSAEDLLGSGEERTVKGAAMGWLRDLLKAEGPLTATEVRERAKAEDIAGRTLDRAKAALGVRSAKDGLDGAWAWSLPHVGDVGVLGVLPVVTGLEGWRPSKDAWQGCQERQGRQGVVRAPAREGAPLLVDELGSEDAVVQAFVERFDAVEIDTAGER